MSIDKKKLFLWLVGAGILFPLFFTFNGGIYRYPGTINDSGGILADLPLPISILTCLVALMVLLPRLREARPALAMVAGTTVVACISLLLGGGSVTASNRKLIMILQVGLPMIGLIVGQLIEDEEKIVAKAFTAVLTIITPLQLSLPLVNTPWSNNDQLLADYLYLFTIYSHIQYVTLIFTCAYAYALSVLWNEHKAWLLVLSITFLFYVLRSYSYLTMVAYGAIVFAFIGWQFFGNQKNVKALLAVLLVAILALIGTFALHEKYGAKDSFISRCTGSAYSKIKPLLGGEIPENVQQRIGDWKLFGGGIIESKKTLLVGHPEPMPREIRTSPHNWYMDVAYNFGLVGLLPIITLIGYSANLCWRKRKSVSRQTWWLAAIVFYLVIVDSNFKVTLRQPYPGIFAFFMWGMLLTRLAVLKSAVPGK